MQMNWTQQIRRVSLVMATAGILFSPTLADASGFASARFGGERGNPTETNPTTIYYNPAGIGMSTGFQLMGDVNLVWRTASYDRPESAIDEETILPGRSDDLNEAIRNANSGVGDLNNLIYTPFFGVSYNFREQGLPLAIGAAFFAPFGGQAEWNRPGGDDRLPGSGDGPQRWFTIDGSIRTLAFAGNVAYHIEPIRLSLGATFNYYLSDMDTIRARNRMGEDYVLSAEHAATGGSDDDPIAEGRAWVVADSTDFGLGLGALWEPIEDKLWVGFSWQSRPNFDGNMEFEGDLTQILGDASSDEVYHMKATQQLPDIWRLGVRYRVDERLELRAFGDLTRWSAFKEQCLVDTEVLRDSDLREFCRTRADGSPVTQASGQFLTVIPRRWHDAFGVRIGASYWFKPEVELQLGLGYDGNAVPDRTLEPALIDANKFSLSVGTQIDVLDSLALTFTLTNIFFVERDTRGVESADTFALPSRQPNSSGVYNQNYLLFGTNIAWAF